MIKGVIFDLDGIIIDSEPYWKLAEKKVFKSVGIKLTTEMCKKTTGLDNNSTVRYWYNYQPWMEKTLEEVATEIIDEVLTSIMKHGAVNKGVMNLLKLFGELKIPVAVASSSEKNIIQTVLEKIKLKDKFAAVCSSEDEEFGKPHPAVYIKAARMMNVEPESCLAFEDSFYGALSAKSARMKVVAVLHKDIYTSTKFDFADLKLRSLEEFGTKEFEIVNKEV